MAERPVVSGVGRVAFVLKGYPRLSETFIAQEIAALERLGLPILIVSLRHPTDSQVHPIHAEIKAPVVYLPEYLYNDPLRVLRAWWRVRRLPGYGAARGQWLRDWWRDRSANRGRRFGQALVLAAELPADVVRLHAHFLHTPASVTRYAAMVRGLPWSGSAHAKDIWTSPQWELREKLASCDWQVTCTATNRDYLATLAPAGRVELVYHGLDLQRFAPDPGERAARDGTALDDPVVLMSVGRLVEKKGTDILLQALALLPPDLHWRLDHVGGGPLRKTLQAQARSLGLSERIQWRGALAQQQVIALYRNADLFALASRIAGDGDRDGLPNVLMEAQSQGVACVATDVSAIHELIVDGQSGLLVPPQDAQALALALESLIRDPQRRLALGTAGRMRVNAAFGLSSNIARLARKFGLRPTPDDQAA
ncbi:MAG: glycosyltransferase family 4 protein [Rhodoferax sp.]|nr:glycosyltransferase family 4 protein [Rhodoferax sp.]HQZ06019.1 glycosyltransferase family 4 protein [Burkholderiaceae bacterium]HRA61610.1 glycosyltransferase family 4 protein [Burkholderiaceae bacterium]